ncbi:MAG: phosphatase PAP2 family protein [Patescibacteria group bacterium]
MKTLELLDSNLTFLLSNLFPKNAFFYSIFRALSVEGSYIWVWISVAAIVFALEYFTHKQVGVFLRKLFRVTIVLFITALITYLSVSYIAKPIFKRERPYESAKIEALYCPKDYSFPSGHAAVAWAGAYILIKFDSKRRREITYCLIAAFVSYSRIYLTCHYFGDVLFGALFGIGIAALTFEGYRRFFLTDKQLKLIK